MWLSPAIDSFEVKGSWLCFDEAEWAVGGVLSTLSPELVAGEGEHCRERPPGFVGFSCLGLGVGWNWLVGVARDPKG